MAQTVKNLPAMQETRVQSLGGEDPLEKEMATDSSILAWKIPWTGKSGGLQSMGLQRVGHDRSDLAHTHSKGGRRDSLDQQKPVGRKGNSPHPGRQPQSCTNSHLQPVRILILSRLHQPHTLLNLCDTCMF